MPPEKPVKETDDARGHDPRSARDVVEYDLRRLYGMSPEEQITKFLEAIPTLRVDPKVLAQYGLAQVEDGGKSYLIFNPANQEEDGQLKKAEPAKEGVSFSGDKGVKPAAGKTVKPEVGSVGSIVLPKGFDSLNGQRDNDEGKVVEQVFKDDNVGTFVLKSYGNNDSGDLKEFGKFLNDLDDKYLDKNLLDAKYDPQFQELVQMVPVGFEGSGKPFDPTSFKVTEIGGRRALIAEYARCPEDGTEIPDKTTRMLAVFANPDAKNGTLDIVYGVERSVTSAGLNEKYEPAFKSIKWKEADRQVDGANNDKNSEGRKSETDGGKNSDGTHTVKRGDDRTLVYKQNDKKGFLKEVRDQDGKVIAQVGMKIGAGDKQETVTSLMFDQASRTVIATTDKGNKIATGPAGDQVKYKDAPPKDPRGHYKRQFEQPQGSWMYLGARGQILRPGAQFSNDGRTRVSDDGKSIINEQKVKGADGKEQSMTIVRDRFLNITKVTGADGKTLAEVGTGAGQVRSIRLDENRRIIIGLPAASDRSSYIDAPDISSITLEKKTDEIPSDEVTNREQHALEQAFQEADRRLLQKGPKIASAKEAAKKPASSDGSRGATPSDVETPKVAVTKEALSLQSGNESWTLRDGGKANRFGIDGRYKKDHKPNFLKDAKIDPETGILTGIVDKDNIKLNTEGDTKSQLPYQLKDGEQVKYEIRKEGSWTEEHIIKDKPAYKISREEFGKDSSVVTKIETPLMKDGKPVKDGFRTVEFKYEEDKGEEDKGKVKVGDDGKPVLQRVDISTRPSGETQSLIKDESGKWRLCKHIDEGPDHSGWDEPVPGSDGKPVIYDADPKLTDRGQVIERTPDRQLRVYESDGREETYNIGNRPTDAKQKADADDRTRVFSVGLDEKTRRNKWVQGIPSVLNQWGFNQPRDEQGNIGDPRVNNGWVKRMGDQGYPLWLHQEVDPQGSITRRITHFDKQGGVDVKYTDAEGKVQILKGVQRMTSERQADGSYKITYSNGITKENPKGATLANFTSTADGKYIGEDGIPLEYRKPEEKGKFVPPAPASPTKPELAKPPADKQVVPVKPGDKVPTPADTTVRSSQQLTMKRHDISKLRQDFQKETGKQPRRPREKQQHEARLQKLSGRLSATENQLLQQEIELDKPRVAAAQQALAATQDTAKRDSIIQGFLNEQIQLEQAAINDCTNDPASASRYNTYINLLQNYNAHPDMRLNFATRFILQQNAQPWQSLVPTTQVARPQPLPDAIRPSYPPAVTPGVYQPDFYPPQPYPIQPPYPQPNPQPPRPRIHIPWRQRRS